MTNIKSIIAISTRFHPAQHAVAVAAGNIQRLAAAGRRHRHIQALAVLLHQPGAAGVDVVADAAQALTEAADIAAVLDDPAVQRAQRIPHRLHTFALHRIARRRQHPVGADPGPAAQRRRRGLQAAGVQRDTRPVRRHRR
ncbi:hypothetical protein EYY87_13980, partial [Hafnia paralvei]|uniref:hypothetical protein n=1 Tax=Hafnia paralvei TaxID=546367 RepID=UPI0010353A55